MLALEKCGNEASITAIQRLRLESSYQPQPPTVDHPSRGDGRTERCRRQRVKLTPLLLQLAPSYWSSSVSELRRRLLEPQQ